MHFSLIIGFLTENTKIGYFFRLKTWIRNLYENNKIRQIEKSEWKLKIIWSKFMAQNLWEWRI